MTLEKSDPKITNFFIFNSKFGQKEGQEKEKLLYYYPKSDSLDFQVRQVGLAEALALFSNTFNKDADCESLHTHKTHQVYYQPEPNIWMVLTVAVGWIRRQKENGLFREYQSEGIQDEVVQALLKEFYRAFALRHLSFETILERNKKASNILSGIFDELIAKVDLNKGGILSLWSGVSFQPLGRQTFLKIHCMLSLLQASFPSIAHTAFLYQNNFVWCGFSMDDLRALSEYLSSLQLCCDFSSSSHSLESSSFSSSSSQSSVKQIGYLSRFIGDSTTPSSVIHVHDDEGRLSPYHLLLYSVDKICIPFTLPESEILSPVMFDKVYRLIDAKVIALAKDIGEQPLPRPNQPEGFRYLYHNHMNLATKSSVGSLSTLPHETLQTVVDMHSDLIRNQCSELVVKTAHDFWVVGKWNNGRESFIIISRKNANLVEVTDEVTRLCSQDFNNIFTIS